MANSRVRQASNRSQVILERLTHPLLPLFRRTAPHCNPLIPLFLRRAPGDNHLLPLFMEVKWVCTLHRKNTSNNLAGFYFCTKYPKYVHKFAILFWILNPTYECVSNPSNQRFNNLSKDVLFKKFNNCHVVLHNTQTTQAANHKKNFMHTQQTTQAAHIKKPTP